MDCLPKKMAITGLSKVAGCRRKSPPIWLVSTGYSPWHFFIDGVFKIKYRRLAAYFDNSAVYYKGPLVEIRLYKSSSYS